jgi:hypothetical protein
MWKAIQLVIQFSSLIPKLIGLLSALVILWEGIRSGITGPEKKAGVMKALKENWDVWAKKWEIEAAWTVVEPLCDNLIDVIVTVFNLIGWFKKVAPPVATPVEVGPSTDSVVDGIVTER